MGLAPVDIAVVVVYGIAIFALAQFVAREKKGHAKDTSDYFLASKNLPWWAIGASLIDGRDPDGTRMEKHLVFVGRTVAVLAVVIALIVVRPLLGQSQQAFQYIQEFTGFFTPGITVMFLLGLFWKRASEAGAIAAAVSSVLLSFVFWFPAQYGGSAALNSVPFMHRMEIAFAISLVLAVVVSLVWPARKESNRITMDGVSFATPSVFNVGALGVVLILIALYASWW
jgi:SSS family solute:Na+ symporter